MVTILVGILFYLVFFFISIIIWNFYKPKGEIKPLLISLIISFIFIYLFNIIKNYYFYNVNIIYSNTLSIILYMAITTAYILTFPAINILIPSFKILTIINTKGPLKSEEIIEYFSASELIDSRIEMLKNDGLFDNNSYNNIGVLGKIIAIIFIIYRKILGASIGKG